MNTNDNAWIPVAERLPDSETTVMVYAPAADPPVWLGYYDERDHGDGWWSVDEAKLDVTHWTHTPEPPNDAWRAAP